MKKILYISYDGMTDPLGQSQVLPYLTGLSRFGYEFTILSFEKKERYPLEKERVEKIMKSANIRWVPLPFTRKPPILSKFYDAMNMRRKAIQLQRKYRFDMVHCRSYVPADVGLLLKKKFGVKFFFDMRGFWADEKKDGNSWNQDSFIFRKVYRYYKKKEANYLHQADHIISLTRAGKKELMTWPSYKVSTPVVDVIPCCADMQLFSVTDADQKNKSRDLLQLPKDTLIISYLGSIGAWYMLDEMLELFSIVKKQYPNAIFLFVTISDPQTILDKLGKYGLLEQNIKIIKASRTEVPLFMKASDISISFIKPVYSKISSSPTKLAEVLAMGIPVISNGGVGDVAEIIEESGGGVIIKEFNTAGYEQIVSMIPTLLTKDPLSIRNKIYKSYSLEQGIELYLEAYKATFEGISNKG